MKCNCMNDVLKKVEERALESAPAHVKETWAVDWENSLFVISGPSFNVALPVRIKYKQKKPDGTAFVNYKRDRINVFMTYCPFCGHDAEGNPPGIDPIAEDRPNLVDVPPPVHSYQPTTNDLDDANPPQED